MSDDMPKSWDGRERRRSLRLRLLLGNMGDRIDELHRELQRHTLQIDLVRKELDQLKSNVTSEPFVRQKAIRRK